ncbi:hypothetical protein GN958_ATG18578 [Phytophthora infestans]|uniref:Uncharacterized protein n=1 Tax=Phytophthora infestans TaxID=4787 RepID=A0A8S9TW38_PHYIN|nr:hypothetical protein GN958_ATG18578 [Phytophthora infestans]
MATTNNPVGQYSAALKRDVIVHRKLKMGVLLCRQLDWCHLESARSMPFALATVANPRLQDRAREIECKGPLSEHVVSRHSVAYMMGEVPAEAMSPDVMYIRSVAASRPYSKALRRRHENLPVTAQLALNTARMETMGMPSTGWKVDVCLMTCPCRFVKKFA